MPPILLQREHRMYLAGKSAASLEQVCASLEQTLALDPFDYDAKQGASASLPQTIEEYRSALKQPDFGMYFLDYSAVLPRPVGISSMDDAKLHLREFLGQRSGSMGATESIGNLVANYSAVTRKRVSFGRRWREVTNAVSYDDSKPRTRRETLQIMEEILRMNGGFIFPLNATNVVLLTEKDLEDLGHRRE